MILYMYIALGQGQTAPREQNFDVNRNVSSLQSFVASSKKMSLKSDFKQFFLWFNTPRGQNFDVNRKALSLYPFVASFKEISLKSDFIPFFNDLIYVYSPGAGGIQPPGDKVLMLTETSCLFLLVLNHRWQYFLKNSLFYLFPIQKQKGPILTLLWNRPRSTQGHHLNKVGSTRAPDAAYQVSMSSAFWFWRRRFFKVFTIYGHGGHLGHVTRTLWINFHSPIPWRLHMKLGFNRPSGFWEEDV